MSHIPCLRDLLYTFVFVFPNAFTLFARGVRLPAATRVVREYLPLTATFGGLTVLGWLGGYLGALTLALPPAWAAVGVAGGLLAVGLEYLVAAAPRVFAGRGWPTLAPTAIYRGPASWAAVGLIVVAATLEETVHRQLLIGGTLPAMGAPVGLAVAVSTVTYALNHGFFGRPAVLQKLASGLVLSVLFVLSGGLLVVPALAHATQNLALYWHATRSAGPAPVPAQRARS